MTFRAIALLLATLLSATAARAEGFLKVDGTRIVDDSGEPIVLRGMGLGGWMLQEGYMLQLGEIGPQHRIQIGRAHVCTPVTNAPLGCTSLLDNKITTPHCVSAAYGET